MVTCPRISRIKSKLSDIIRDFLGHTSITTTEIYARADSKVKREALERAYTETISKENLEDPLWKQDIELMEWLKGFK